MLLLSEFIVLSPAGRIIGRTFGEQKRRLAICVSKISNQSVADAIWFYLSVKRVCHFKHKRYDSYIGVYSSTITLRIVRHTLLTLTQLPVSRPSVLRPGINDTGTQVAPAMYVSPPGWCIVV
jgi:hypothetical protein